MNASPARAPIPSAFSSAVPAETVPRRFVSHSRGLAEQRGRFFNRHASRTPLLATGGPPPGNVRGRIVSASTAEIASRRLAVSASSGHLNRRHMNAVNIQRVGPEAAPLLSNLLDLYV